MRPESPLFSLTSAYFMLLRYPSQKEFRQIIIEKESKMFREKVENDLRLIGLGQTKGDEAWTH